MSETPHPFFRLLREDRRYKPEAYQFVREALSYGQDVLDIGSEQPTEDEEDADLELPDEADEESWEPQVERHLTGQQLCESIRKYALEQYGFMAKVVLNSWGLHTTGDFGEIVYNLIDIGMMKRSQEDRREDFDDCYDFDEAFQRQFQINMPKD